jgi:hypothetical protein
MLSSRGEGLKSRQDQHRLREEITDRLELPALPSSRRRQTVTGWRPGKKSNYLRCDKFEIAFLGFLSDLDWHSLAGKRNRRRERQLRRSWKPFSRKSTVVADGWPSSGPWSAREASPTRSSAAVDSEEARQAGIFTGRKEKFAASLPMARSRAMALESPEDSLAIIRSGDPEIRLKLKSEIRKRVSRTEVSCGLDGFEAAAEVKFINGVQRGIILDGKRVSFCT